MTDEKKPARKRTLVKLDDKLIEIKKTKKGLVATELNDDETFQASLLEDGLDELVKNDLNKLANEAYSELRAGFKSTLKANVLRIAGFEDRWGNGYEIDHCNGRMSMMTEYLSKRVQDTIKQEIDTLISQQDLADLLKDTKKGLLREAKEIFFRQARDQMRAQVAETTQQFIKDEVERFLTKNQQKLMKEASAKFFGHDSDDGVIDIGED